MSVSVPSNLSFIWISNETNASYFYTYIKVDYNNLAVAINGTYMTGFANFSDSGTLIVNPSTLALFRCIRIIILSNL